MKLYNSIGPNPHVVRMFIAEKGIAMEMVNVDIKAADLKQIAQENLAWLDKQIAGRKYICGDRMTLADLMLYAFLAFGTDVGQPVNPELKNVSALYSRMRARPSAAA